MALNAGDANLAAELLRNYFLEHPDVHLHEPGQLPARIGGDGSGYALDQQGSRLVCHFWSPQANLVRRITGIRQSGDRLLLDVIRLGQSRPLRMTITSATSVPLRAGERLAFRQALVAAAERDWPEWRCQPTTAPAEHSRLHRLLFRRQHHLLPCVALDDASSAANCMQALAQSLVWAQQCRLRDPESLLAAVRLVLPQGAEAWLRLLRSSLRAAPPLECFRLDTSAGRLEPVALSDTGNTDFRLRRAPQHQSPDHAAAALLARVRLHCPQATWELTGDGLGFISVYGLEAVRQSADMEAAGAAFVFGCGGEQTPLLPATDALFQTWLLRLGRERTPEANRTQPLYALQPERWMGNLLQHDPSALDLQLHPEQMYAQVPMSTPGGTGVLDLLALNRAGRLIAIELKATEDLCFPLQALTYWSQVRQHLGQGDLQRLGYFPGRVLSSEPPLLWLVAPALRWHPDTPLLTRWFAPEVPATLIGINEEWRRGFQIVFRKDL